MAHDITVMRVNVVLAANYVFESVHMADQVHDLAPTWGSWKSWKQCNTHNVICHELTQARTLLQRAMQAVCNFYVPQKLWLPLDRPQGLHYYQGDFLQNVDNLEDIIAMHLVAEISDLVLLFGFDINQPDLTTDQSEPHLVKNRLGLIKQCVESNQHVQWVLVDHDRQLDSTFNDLTNLTSDTTDCVLQLLGTQ